MAKSQTKAKTTKPPVRYHPRVYFRGEETASDQPSYAPALLAKITNNQGNITGCARTYLDPVSGRISDLGSPKRILGQLHSNAVRFWSASDPVDLIVGEGLENTLSVGTALPEFNLASPPCFIAASPICKDALMTMNAKFAKAWQYKTALKSPRSSWNVCK